MPILDKAKRVGIWGFGLEGQAALRFIRQNYPGIELTILNDTTLDTDEQVELIQGDEVQRTLRDGRFDVVVKSPGISLYRDEIAIAKKNGVRFTSGTNLWFEQNQAAKKIAVTGTKGKSTTARLLHFMLKQTGLDVRIIGNVGIPALGQAPGRDTTILELSSYQIADLEHAPDMAVVTNLFPEHAPWHGGAEQYFHDKLRILDLSPTTIGVCNFTDERLRQRLSDRNNIIWFNREQGFQAKGGQLYFDQAPVHCPEFPLKGEHNLGNLAAACAAADALGFHEFRRLVDVRNFRQLHHRLEEFRPAPDILCVNDSIATVPEATLAALRTYPDFDTILLLGGTDRGQDYSQLFSFLPGMRVRSVILLPPVGKRIFDEMSGLISEIELLQAANLKQAVDMAFQRVAAGGLVLLSPGAPSFGEHRNFEERGERFRSYCEEYVQCRRKK
jgi:UDP-N-acetylmuramoyl-L-alanine---L-glutamate ligase